MSFAQNLLPLMAKSESPAISFPLRLSAEPCLRLEKVFTSRLQNLFTLIQSFLTGMHGLLPRISSFSACMQKMASSSFLPAMAKRSKTSSSAMMPIHANTMALMENMNLCHNSSKKKQSPVWGLFLFV